MDNPKPGKSKGKGRMIAAVFLSADARGFPSDQSSTSLPPAPHAVETSRQDRASTPASTRDASATGRLSRVLNKIRTPRSASPRIESSPLLVSNDRTTGAKAEPDTAATGDSSGGLLSKRVPWNEREDREDFEMLKEFLDTSVKVLAVAGEAVKAVPVPLIPGLVGGCLKLSSDSLAVLKKMVENREAWQKLIKKVDDHQAFFNEQMSLLGRGNDPIDPKSSLIGPVKAYAVELENLMKDVLKKSNGIIEGELEELSADQVKQWIRHYMHVEMTKEEIESHAKKLSSAMDKLQTALATYTAFTAKTINDGVDQVLYANIQKLLFPLGTGIQLPASNQDNVPSPSPSGSQHKVCHPETRVNILREINQWAHCSGGSTVYVLNDIAGIGKSTIARSIAQKWREEKILISAFFFSRGTGGTSTAFDLICHLVAAFVSKEQVINDPGMSYKKIFEALMLPSVEEQWAPLIYHPVSLLDKEAGRTGSSILIVIDAFDECSEFTRSEFLRLLLEMVKPGPTGLNHVKVLLTTRPEHDIKRSLEYYSHVRVDEFKNYPLDRHDLEVFIKCRFGSMGLTEVDVLALSDYSQGLFILAETACSALESSPIPKLLLEKITAGSSGKGIENLDKLYYRILESKTKAYDFDERKACNSVWRLILGARRPLLPCELKALLMDDEVNIAHIVGNFSSVIGSGSEEDPVYIRHPTFREFMLDPDRSRNNGLTIESSHLLLSSLCLRILTRDLRPNLFQIDPAVSFEERYAASDFASGPQDHVNSTLLYAALNWTFHVAGCITDGSLLHQIRQFFVTKLLNWIELGALAIRIPEFMDGIHQMNTAVGSLVIGSNRDDTTTGTQWCIDILAFMRAGQALLQRFPLHVYSSILTFEPHQSLVHQSYEPSFRHSLPKIHLGGVPAATVTTSVLAGHKKSIRTLAYSNDGKLLVSVSISGCIIVWDTHTGAMRWMPNMKAVRGYFQGIVFLPDNNTIVSIWVHYWSEPRSETCQLLRSSVKSRGSVRPPDDFEVPGGSSCMAWAPDLSKFVCGTGTGHIYLFMLGPELKPGICVGAHDGEITGLSFSSDGRSMASISGNTIDIWFMTGGGLTEPITAQRQSIRLGASDGSFSPSKQSIFSFVDENLLHIYNVDKISMDLELRHKYKGMDSMVYSPDGNHIAVYGKHHGDITIVNLLSRDQNNMPSTRELNTGHDRIFSLKFSPDNRYLATGGGDSIIRIHDLRSTDDPTYSGRLFKEITSLGWNHMGDWVAACNGEGASIAWEGKVFQRYNSFLIYEASQIALSSSGIAVGARDSRKIAFCSIESDEIIGATLWLGYLAPKSICAMAFSPDDTKLAMVTADCDLVLVDIEKAHLLPHTPSTIIRLSSLASQNGLAFHPSGAYICYDNYAWDLASNPARPLADDRLSAILNETFPLCIEWDRASLSILVGSHMHQPLYMPEGFSIKSVAIQGSLIALGGYDGRVVVLDLLPLATEDIKALINRVEAMRREAVNRSRPSRLHQLLSSYSGPDKIRIPVEPPLVENEPSSDCQDISWAYERELIGALPEGGGDWRTLDVMDKTSV